MEAPEEPTPNGGPERFLLSGIRPDIRPDIRIRLDIRFDVRLSPDNRLHVQEGYLADLISHPYVEY